MLDRCRKTPPRKECKLPNSGWLFRWQRISVIWIGPSRCQSSGWTGPSVVRLSRALRSSPKNYYRALHWRASPRMICARNYTRVKKCANQAQLSSSARALTIVVLSMSSWTIKTLRFSTLRKSWRECHSPKQQPNLKRIRKPRLLKQLPMILTAEKRRKRARKLLRKNCRHYPSGASQTSRRLNKRWIKLLCGLKWTKFLRSLAVAFHKLTLTSKKLMLSTSFSRMSISHQCCQCQASSAKSLIWMLLTHSSGARSNNFMS